MAGMIRLTPEELRTSAIKYSQGSTEITDILNSLTAEQQRIAGNWAGASFEKFQAQFESLTPKVKQFSTLLQEIHDQLVSVAQVLQDTDQNIASQINTL